MSIDDRCEDDNPHDFLVTKKKINFDSELVTELLCVKCLNVYSIEEIIDRSIKIKGCPKCHKDE
jgi:hypothetical protein